MAQQKFESGPIVELIEYCYDQAGNEDLDTATQDKYRDCAERLEILRKKIVSKQFDDATAEYKRASRELKDVVESLKNSTDTLNKIVALLGTVEQVIKILEELLSKVVFV